MAYDHKSIDKKWQEQWEKEKLYQTPDKPDPKNKKYILDMFPYPSGAGLHVGHPEGPTANDILARFYRMSGYDVLHPMGWDAFGLPAENYAIKTGTPPAKSTQENITTFRRQIGSIGLSYDWSREIDTSNPDYYKWTQWLFLKLYEKGLAYKKEAYVNWCPKDQTVLANEQVREGKCDRCGTQVIQKLLSQWFFKITDYAEELLNGLEPLDWPDPIKLMQKNWIGKSVGANIKFKLSGVPGQEDGKHFVQVFTTRPDTLFGATFLVISPETARKWIEVGWQASDEVNKYITDSLKKTELARIAQDKDKTGVDAGIFAINPATEEKIPVWIADYVLGTYGTGAIMAVPAHDERDFEFAQKFGLPIKKVIEPLFLQTVEPGKIRQDLPFVEREAIAAVVKHWTEDKYIGLKWKKVPWQTVITGGVEKGQTPEQAAIAEIVEETGYKNPEFIENLGMVHSKFFHPPKNENRFGHFHMLYFKLQDGQRTDIAEKESEIHDVVWLTFDEMQKFLTPESHKYSFNYAWQSLKSKLQNLHGHQIYDGEGILVNSGEYTGMESSQAREKMTLAFGEERIQYKIRDWLVSRQRYWGAPIPIIYCDNCGMVPVPEKSLPVILPTDVDFLPTGESPITRSKSFHEVTCPKCDGKAHRDSDTMDTFVDSSWYYFRFADPHNHKEFASKHEVQKWLPVDTYVGGAEHAVLHLLYSRFITKVLRDLGFINFSEPFKQLRNQGLILGPDGEKMSKSRGNVINPDEVLQEYGADTFRMYEMFMGPLEDAKPWSTQGIVGLSRFLDRVSKLAAHGEDSKDIHKLIFKITKDIHDMKFNTAIAAFMEYLNYHKQLSSNDLETFIKLLAPFAPHVTEEIWHGLGHKDSIHKQLWPEYDENLVKDEIVKIVIQVNGKTKGTIDAPVGLKGEDLKKIVDSSELYTKLGLKDKKKSKVIHVPDRLVNFVIEE
jgi:leucyl-tRNA synthetase